MAADSSFTHIIFFIASILVAVSISGVIIGISGSMAEEIKLKADNAASEMGTSVVFVNDPRSMPYDNGKLTLYLKNTGEIPQHYNDMTIFIDGQYVDCTASSMSGNEAMLVPGDMAKLEVEVDLGSGDHWVKAVMGNGVSVTMDFILQLQQ